MAEYSSKQRAFDICFMLFFIVLTNVEIYLAMNGYSPADFAETYVVFTLIVCGIVECILPIMRITKKFICPYWFLLFITSVPVLHSSTLFLGFYKTFKYWDIFAHTFASIVVGTVVFLALAIIEHYTTRVHLGSVPVMMFLAFIMSWGFGVIWEMYESGYDYLFNDAAMSYSMFDTCRDLLISDLLGCTLTDVVIYLIIRKYSLKAVVESMNLSEFMVAAGKKWDKLTMDDYQGSYLHRERPGQ